MRDVGVPHQEKELTMAADSFVIRRVRLFDGETVTESTSVAVQGDTITYVGDEPALHGVKIVDGEGMTLLPGLIDGHAHAKPPALEQALVFGVTTEMDMGSVPTWMRAERKKAAERNDVADVRSSSFGATVLGGHPSMLIGSFFDEQFPTVHTLEDVPTFIADRVADGADYIKLLIDDGTALGHPSPTLSPELAAAIASEAHSHGLLAVAHVTTIEGASQAIRAGVDGLVHLFMDAPPTDEIIALIKDSGAFVVPTLSTLGSLAGDITGEDLAKDPRVTGFLSPEWNENLCECWHLGGPSRLDYALEATRRLHSAGVPVLLGTDAASLGIFGTAHGISVHGELRLLVKAGFTPVEALRAATSRVADAFGLADRGRIREGLQADLLLVEGDPTDDIEHSLSIAGVWRRGERLDRARRFVVSAAEEAARG